MSEQRYGVHHCPNGLYYLRDVTDHSVYIHRNYGYLYSPYKEDIELVSTLLNELVDKVDEQQTTISILKEENEQLQEEIKRLEKMIWKIQWRFQQEVGIEKARKHYQEIDKEMEE